MIRFVVQRFASGLLVMAGVIIVIFALFLLINVDPAKMTLGQRSDIASEEAVRQRLGLDAPWHKRLFTYVGELSPVWLHDTTSVAYSDMRALPVLTFGRRALVLKWPYLGRSFQTNRPVTALLGQAIVNTLILAIAALLVALIAGLTFGIVTALRAGSWLDRLLVSLAAIGVSIPSYFSAIVFSFLFGFLWGDITGLNMIGSLRNIHGQWQWENLILPTLALGIRPVAVITQLTRSAMLSVLSEDYMRTARAKGLSNYDVVVKHGLRNAVNPVITAVSGWLASLLTGAYFVEVIFNFKGLGYVTIAAIETYDFPVIMGSVLLGATLFVVINMLVDILYAVFDPKIKVAG